MCIRYNTRLGRRIAIKTEEQKLREKIDRGRQKMASGVELVVWTCAQMYF